MMYQHPRFSVRLYSADLAKNWEATFGKKPYNRPIPAVDHSNEKEVSKCQNQESPR